MRCSAPASGDGTARRYHQQGTTGSTGGGVLSIAAVLERTKHVPVLGSKVLPTLRHQIVQLTEGHGVLRLHGRW
jgi:hypothetical protein